MILKKIKLKNFKNFENAQFNFEDLNFIKGDNGTGKTSLSYDSLLFSLFGYTTKQKLKNLVTRWSDNKNCKVEVTFEHEKLLYKVIRYYPTKIKIFKQIDKMIKYENGEPVLEELKFSTNTEAQNYIEKLLGKRNVFQKFRVIDAYSSEANFLEEGNSTIKKIIFDFSDNLFNKFKEMLLSEKRDREVFNKDNLESSPFYPSKKRLKILNEYIDKIDQDLKESEKKLSNLRKDVRKSHSKMNTLSIDIKNIGKKQSKLEKNKKCYTCNRKIDEKKKEEMLDKLNKEKKSKEKKYNKYKKSYKMDKEIVETYEKPQKLLRNKKIKINNLKTKLENKFNEMDRNKKYKYTTKDVEIAKKALKEVDNLSSYYLKESIRILEPIINTVLKKIDFQVKFTINKKGKFTISLQKKDTIYSYDDLSNGEKLILQIAFKLAILTQKGETGLIIADEGMSSLDERNLRHVLKIFRNYPFQLLLVLHRFNKVPINLNIIDLNKRRNNEKNIDSSKT